MTDLEVWSYQCIEVFQHVSANIVRMEPTLRSAQVLKQETEDIGYEGQEVLDYVKEKQKLDREERAEWRNIWMAELQAEENNRADELQAEKKKRAGSD